jgi:transcription initiation factor IIF auxiliary subunit
MSTQLEIRQSEKYEGNDWWKWAVWVEGPEEALDQIDYVEWMLHPTFPNPVRKCHDRETKYKLETAGWGVFPIRARVWNKDGSNTTLSHYLKLHYEDGRENTA